MSSPSRPRPLGELARQCHETAVSKGWWQDGDRNHGEMFVLMVSELTEAFEEIRKGFAPREIYFDEEKPEGVPIELADCLIRILDYCYANEIDLDFAMRLKMEYNMTRPYRHGNKTA